MINNELIKLELVGKNFEIPDYDNLVKHLKEEVQKYRLDTVNEDTYKLAKSNKAALNNVIDAVDDARKKAEKKYMEPFLIGKDQCKTLTSICKEVVDELDKGIKEVDKGTKEDKKAKIQEYFKRVNIYPITLDDILDAKWLNKTTKIEDIQKDIDTRMILIKNDINDLKSAIQDKEALKTILFLYFTNDMNIEITLLKYSKYLDMQEDLNYLI